jgi:DinB superfamily
MPITPDTKNWTWVVERPCAECGFDASTFDAVDVADLLRANAAAWPAVLESDDVTVRPDDSTWSALEYAAHVRDVFRIFRVRLDLMLTTDDPLFANWDQDKSAIDDRYNEQDPAVVSSEIVDAAAALSDAFAAIPDDAWSRTGRRSDGAEFTVESFAKYFIHDPTHHLWDVTK